MVPNDEIMLAVFKAFIDNPEMIRKTNNGHGKDDITVIDQYMPYADFPDTDRNLIRWHVVALLDEFVLRPAAASVIFQPYIRRAVDPADLPVWYSETLPLEQPPYQLNWSGQQLYATLRKKLKRTTDDDQ